MKNYWQSLSPLMQHLHVFGVGALVVLLPVLMTGARPTEQQYLMALGAGLAACFGLSLPAPAK